MEITNCPECAAETVNGGLALWADEAEALIVFECVGDDCAWVGVSVEYWAELAPRASVAA